MIESLQGQILAEAATHQALSGAIDAMQAELRGLRSAAQVRAVVEQAKGVLVERHHITLDEAFERLRVMAHEGDVRLVEAAASVMGVAIPFPADDEQDDGQDARLGTASRSGDPGGGLALMGAPGAVSGSTPELEPRSGPLAAQVAIGAGAFEAGAIQQGGEAAQLVAELLAGQEVAAVTMFRAAPDGSLRLLGQQGVPWEEIAPWRSIPPSRDIPYIRSLQDQEVLHWDDRAARASQFPHVRPTPRFEAAMTIPIQDGTAVVGVVGLFWSRAQVLAPDRVAAISQLVQRVSPTLMRTVTMMDPERAWLDTMLGMHVDPWLQLEPVAGTDGAVSDFVVSDFAPRGRGSADWVGRRLLELWPAAAHDGMAKALGDLVRTGGAWSSTVTEASDSPWGRVDTRVRAVRLGQQVVLVWRPPATA